MRGIRGHRSLPLMLLTAAAVSACGGGGGGGDSSGTGTLSVGITDAARYDVYQVVVRFTAVTVKPKNGGQQRFEINPEATPPGKSVDLMQLTGGDYEQLLQDQELPIGEYEWVGLEVVDDDTGLSNYVRVDLRGLQEPLEVPNNSRAGLRLVSGFTILANQSTEFMIDWDLNKALTYPRNGDGIWKLRPALRITDKAEYGRIEGTVNPSLFRDISECAYDDLEDEGNAVYAFAVPAGVDFADVEVDDIDDEPTDGENPYATALVKHDVVADLYSYSFEYMGLGDYKLAFTCEAARDEADFNDTDEALDALGEQSIEGDPITFTVLDVPVTVINTEGNGQTTTAPEFL